MANWTYCSSHPNRDSPWRATCSSSAGESADASQSSVAFQSNEKKDALRVQGINDLVIFGVAGAGSLASGYVYTAIGWDGLVYVVCGLMGLAGIFLAGSYRAASRRADDPEGSKSGSLSFTISPMTGGCPAPAGMVEPWGKSVSSTSSRSAV